MTEAECYLGLEAPLPTFASFDGIREFALVVVFLFLTWAAFAVLALVSLAFCFSERTRRTSSWCAIACVAASIPVSLLGAVELCSIVSGHPGLGWKFLLLSLAPLLVGTAVFCFDRNRLKKDESVMLDASH